jgi:SAM-dependent methyltransferase
MLDCTTLPPLFRGAREYKDDPTALEMAQATFNEEGLYQSIADFAALWHERAGRPARVVDLCAATGLCTLRVSRRVPVASVTLVDSDPQVLERATQHLSDIPAEVRLGDAAEFGSQSRYDLVLANSAYHHISDDRKIDFLRTARALVAEDGAILIGDHFLPPYCSNVEFKVSVEFFYGQLMAALESRGEPAAAINVIRRAALYCWQGEYEFKVSWPVFLEHCACAGLQIERVLGIWEPRCEMDVHVGTFAIWLRPSG